MHVGTIRTYLGLHPVGKIGENLEVLEAIKSRRSIREYTKAPVPEDLIMKILDAGRWAPSASNRQPWTFVVIKEKEVKKRAAEATTYGKFLADAPLGIAVVVDPQASTHPVEDGAIATQNMLLAAHALGLGACWIGAYNSFYEEKTKTILNIPKNMRLLSIISIGFPAESPTTTRKELEQIVFTDQYGEQLSIDSIEDSDKEHASASRIMLDYRFT